MFGLSDPLKGGALNPSGFSAPPFLFAQMKRRDTRILLVGPSGDRERWTICFRPLRKGHFGETDWVDRVVTINSRLRNLESIRDTILHEVAHVTAGQNASEEFAINVERNYRLTIDTLEKLRYG